MQDLNPSLSLHHSLEFVLTGLFVSQTLSTTDNRDEEQEFIGNCKAAVMVEPGEALCRVRQLLDQWSH